jgi:hypothetical protein
MKCSSNFPALIERIERNSALVLYNNLRSYLLLFSAPSDACRVDSLPAFSQFIVLHMEGPCAGHFVSSPHVIVIHLITWVLLGRRLLLYYTVIKRIFNKIECNMNRNS